MIKLYDYTPEIYYKESRDFQFIGRLFDLVLNYSKTNADLIYALPFSDNSDEQLTELLSLTLGFKAKRKYTTKQLRAICSVFSEIMKNKGTIKAFLIACAAIFNAEGITTEVEYELLENNSRLVLYVPPALGDTTLLTDLFSYIIPAGVSFDIIKLILSKTATKTELGIKDIFTLHNAGDALSENSRLGKVQYDDNISARTPMYLETPEGETPVEMDRNTGVISTHDAIMALVGDKIGANVNSNVYKPKDDNNNNEG